MGQVNGERGKVKGEWENRKREGTEIASPLALTVPAPRTRNDAEAVLRAVMLGRKPGRSGVRRFLEILQGRSWAEIEERMRSAASRLFTTLPPLLAVALLEGSAHLQNTQISPSGEIYGGLRNRGVPGLPPAETSPVGRFVVGETVAAEGLRSSA